MPRPATDTALGRTPDAMGGNSLDSAQTPAPGGQPAAAAAEVIDLRLPRPQGGASSAPVAPTRQDAPPTRRSHGWDDRRRAVERDCFTTLANPAASPTDRERAQHQVVLLHAGLVEHIARKFRDRGEPLEDLVQVGMVGLLKAIARFDVDRDVEFSTYATVTVTGEIKRHFRDRTWAVHMPRRLQELRMLVARAHEDLIHTLGRVPTTAEIAEHLDIAHSQVIAGKRSALAYAAVSLEALTQRQDGSVTELQEFMTEDPALELVDVRRTLVPLLAGLEEREYTIVTLHFFHNCSQSTIAADLGISQMHVSRLLSRALARMRAQLEPQSQSVPRAVSDGRRARR